MFSGAVLLHPAGKDVFSYMKALSSRYLIFFILAAKTKTRSPLQNPLFYSLSCATRSGRSTRSRRPPAVDVPPAADVPLFVQMRHLCFSQSGNKIVKFDDFLLVRNLSGGQQLCRFPFL